MSKFTFPIYLDHHATTPTDIRVYKKMRPFFLRDFGNPASINHTYGSRAQEAIDEARNLVALAIGAHPTEIIFTSGATESSNMAIKGLLMPKPSVLGHHIISSSIDHQATLATLAALDGSIAQVSLLKPTKEGIITEENLTNNLTNETILISLFLVHNEVGSINPIKELAKIAKSKQILFHCDAVQALGRIAIDVRELDIDFLSLSGHKIYGPKGVGCLYAKKSALKKLCPLIHGGGQEWEKRSGTLNVPGIVGMGEAARLAVLHLAEENHRIKKLRDKLLNNLRVLPDVVVNGDLIRRVSGNLHVSFLGIDEEELVLALCQKVAISTGSACSSKMGNQSKVLMEMGIPKEWHAASIRFGLGRYTTEEEIDKASEIIVEQVRWQRKNKAPTKKLINIK